MALEKRKSSNNNNLNKVYRNYEKSDLLNAARKVRNENLTIYQAAKLTGVPYNTIKRFLHDNEDIEHSQINKLGRPFALPVDLEQRIYKYIIDMQELGFGLTVLQVRKLAFDLAASVNRQNMFNPEKKRASKWWWAKFKERYGLCLRVPENLSAYHASMANEVMITDYFTKLDDLLTKLQIKNMASHIWNVDETGLTYVVKPNKVVCQIGKKYVYKRTYAERGQTHTLVGCACADGTFIPPFIIFKGVRWNDSLAKDRLPHSQTKLSPKGWITAELFLEWFQFFISSVPAKTRPLVLLIDSHSAHIGPEIINLAKENSIYLMTFPAHTSHLLQPLDVGVYRSMKSHWATELNRYMEDKPNDMPNRSNFYKIFNPAFLASFSPLNIINSFKKAGACPLNYAAIPAEAIAPSKLTERLGSTTHIVTPQPSISEEVKVLRTTDELLQLPSAPKPSTSNGNRRKRKGDSAAKCLTPPVKNPSTGSSSHAGPSGVQKNSKKQDSDWVCGVCSKTYEEDRKKKTGESWVQCSFCFVPYHDRCQQGPTDDLIYMCDNCGPVSESDDEIH